MFCCVYMFICLIIQSHLVCAFQREQQTAGPQLSAASFLLEPAFLRLGPTPFMCLLMTKHPLSLWTLPPISCQLGSYKRACHTVTCSLTWSRSVTTRGPWAASLHSLGNLCLSRWLLTCSRSCSSHHETSDHSFTAKWYSVLSCNTAVDGHVVCVVSSCDGQAALNVPDESWCDLP